MNYLEQNKEIMNRVHNYLYTALYGTSSQKQGESSTPKGKGVQLDDIFTEIAHNGEKVLYVRKDDELCRMNSCYNPSHEAGKWAEQFEFRSLNNIVVIFGFGNGIMIEKIIDRLEMDDLLFIYEPNRELFEYVMMEYDLMKVLSFERVLISIEGINDFDFHNKLQYSMNITNMKAQVQCVLPYYENLFPESYLTFWKEIRDILMHTVIGINTEVVFGTRLLENDFYNLRYLKDSYTLHNIAPYLRTDLPAIIVAAGPSVKNNLEILRKAKGRAYLIVVDRVLDYILDHGIEPDFVVTVDPMKPIKYFTTREHIDYPLMTELASNWEISERHTGKKIFFNCDSYFQTVYEAAGVQPPFMNTGPCVATVAFSACIQLGFDKIVLVGQDLAYDGEYTHVGGIAEDSANTINVMVEGVDGNQVPSRYDWKEFIIWFKDMIHLHPKITVFDTKQKGAKIPGTVLKSLNEILDLYGAAEICDFSNTLTESIKAFTGESYQKALKYMSDACDDLYAMKKKVRKAVELCDNQIQSYLKYKEGNKYTVENYNKLAKINKYIEDKKIYQIIDIYITALTADDITTMYRRSDGEHLDEVITYQKSKSIYEAILKGIDFIQPLLRERLDQIPK
ncbi:MAG: hypothetical protein K0S04_1305 [Herbinix sp.]|jgi:hypothetical protein|nr:hypothetical protein [Herbinix sp.]